MTKADLHQWLLEEVANFPGKLSLLMVDLTTGVDICSIHPEMAVSSASTIKVGILITLFNQVEQGLLALDQVIPVAKEVILEDSEVFEPENPQTEFILRELIYWMITESDNTATNVLIDLAGMEAVNTLCPRWGTAQTKLQRKMLDWVALEEGRDNLTSARDQYYLYAQLFNRVRRQPEGLWAQAMEMLLCQRSKDGLLRYLSGAIKVANKPGGLDHVCHDAGLFLLEDRPYYLGIFTWDGPSLDGDPQQKKFVGRLSKALYDYHQSAKEEEIPQ